MICPGGGGRKACRPTLCPPLIISIHFIVDGGVRGVLWVLSIPHHQGHKQNNIDIWRKNCAFFRSITFFQPQCLLMMKILVCGYQNTGILTRVSKFKTIRKKIFAVVNILDGRSIACVNCRNPRPGEVDGKDYHYTTRHTTHNGKTWSRSKNPPNAIKPYLNIYWLMSMLRQK